MYDGKQNHVRTTGIVQGIRLVHLVLATYIKPRTGPQIQTSRDNEVFPVLHGTVRKIQRNEQGSTGVSVRKDVEPQNAIRKNQSGDE